MAFRPMNVLLDTAAWINGVKEPETLPAKALAILRNETNRFFLSDIENALPRTFHGDPADRIIAGTAIAHQLTLLTPDWHIAFHRVCRTIRYKWPRTRKRR